jgi:tetratricopeptide (TPR) repeat protein
VIKLLTFGRPNLLDHYGLPVDTVLAQPKRLALLAYLAVAREGDFCSREEVVEMFWPALPRENGRNALSQSLNFLKTALGDDVIRTRGKTHIAIDRNVLWCDAVIDDGRTQTHGLFMDGFVLTGHPAVMKWIEQTRAALEPSVPVSPVSREALSAPPARELNGPFIGRSNEVASVERLLTREARLVTISGAGGVGKSRLAEVVAESLRPSFRDGICIISLAALPADASPLATIAQRLDCQIAPPDDPRRRLVEFLKDKQMLLVLDSIDNVASIDSFIVELIRDATGVRILMTARRPLDMKMEHVIRLEGLAVPPMNFDGDLSAYPATQLFIEIARQVGEPHALSQVERRAVVTMCRFLGGLPLGIEIAASWARSLGIVQVRDALLTDPTALEGSQRRLPERHRSLRTLMVSSWEMLTRPQQIAVARLSVMRVAGDVRTCIRVGGTDLVTIHVLADHALLHRNHDNRLGMHDMVRDFLSARLREMPEEKEDARRRYSHHLADLFGGDHMFNGPGAAAAIALLDAYWDDLRDACIFAAQRYDVGVLKRVLPNLCDAFEVRSRFVPGHQLLSEILALMSPGVQAGETEILDFLRARTAYFALRLGRITEASKELERSLAAAQARNDRSEVAYCELRRGLVYSMSGEHEAARECYSMSFRAYSNMYDRVGTARAIAGLAATLFEVGDLIGAEMYFRRALAIWEAAGDARGVALMQCNLGAIAGEAHAADDAIEMYEKAADYFRNLGDWRMLIIVLSNWARVCILERDPADASPLLAEAEHIADHQGLPKAAIMMNVAAQRLAFGKIHGALEPLRQCIESATSPLDMHVFRSALLMLGNVLVKCDLPHHAAQVAGYFETVPDNPVDEAAFDALTDEIRDALSEEDFHSAKAIGQTLDRDGLVQLVQPLMI